MTKLFPFPDHSLDSDERYTPAWVFDGLGLAFDLDPASPVGGGDHVPAARKYTRDDDGLARDWFGLVWLNPPFSNSAAWTRRFIAHGSGVFLGPNANGKHTTEILEVADRVWIPRDFPFVHPTHAGRRSNMPLLFIALGPTAVAGLDRLATSGRHRGVLLNRLAAK